MTIVASVKVRDGLVLATDSMTQIHQGGQYRTSYANARTGGSCDPTSVQFAGVMGAARCGCLSRPAAGNREDGVSTGCHYALQR